PNAPAAPAAPGLPTPDPTPGEQDLALVPEVHAGFDGLTKNGRWLLVRVVVANDGPPLTGEIRLAPRPNLPNAAVYTQPIELASRARKLIQFQAPGPTGPGDLRVTVAARGQDIAT